jgi:hypothetical protein
MASGSGTGELAPLPVDVIIARVRRVRDVGAMGAALAEEDFW